MSIIDGLIYRCTNTITDGIYIGQTRNGLRGYEKRLYDHFGDAKRGNNNRLSRDIRKYGWDKFEWKIMESNIPTVFLLNQLEIEYISRYKAKNIILNISLGGHLLTPEGKANIRHKNSLQRANLGIARVTEVKKDLAKGISPTAVSRKYNISLTSTKEIKACKIWKWLRMDLNDNMIKNTRKVTRRKIPHNGVKQLDPISREVINIYLTLQSAQEATGAYSTNISKCCKGIKGFTTAGGFQWMYNFDIDMNKNK